MLNLYEILKEVLNESISSNNVVDAINNKYQVIINYSDEQNHAPGKRIIEPYVYGISKAGNEVFRAYQYNGDTYRGIPKWKLFRLDRIQSWQPTNRHFNISPDKNGWNAEAYNENGDNSMSVILNQVNFDKDTTYSPNNNLNVLRKKTANLKRSKPININDLENDTKPINNKTVQSVNKNIDYNSDEFQKMLQKNLETTRKEKNRRGFSLSDDNKEPIINQTVDDVKNGNNENETPIINKTISSELNGNNKYNSDEFQKMLQKNLETTRKEKNKRGFSLSKK